VPPLGPTGIFQKHLVLHCFKYCSSAGIYGRIEIPGPRLSESFNLIFRGVHKWHDGSLAVPTAIRKSLTVRSIRRSECLSKILLNGSQINRNSPKMGLESNAQGAKRSRSISGTSSPTAQYKFAAGRLNRGPGKEYIVD
jgi:hypothetical protein